MYDVIIIGRGPAGLSASLYTSRAGLSTLVIGKFGGSLLKVGRIDNYFGHFGPQNGEDLLKASEKQALAFDVEIIDAEVIKIGRNEVFEILTSGGKYTGKAVLIATGINRKTPPIKKIKDFENKGVAYCTACDGFYYKDMKVGVLGYRDYAVHEAIELSHLTKHVKIYTNGEKLQMSENFKDEIKNITIDERRVIELEGENFLQNIVFEDGEKEKIDGLFIAYESASSMDFAKELGLEVDNNTIVTDDEQKTNVEGVFAAGDCTSKFRQTATAVGEGALSARSIIKYVRDLSKKNNERS